RQCSDANVSSCHHRVPVNGSNAPTLLLYARYKTLFARCGVVPGDVICHLKASDGLPVASYVTSSADVPFEFATNTHVDLSLRFVHTTGVVNTWPPCGTGMICSSPPT